MIDANASLNGRAGLNVDDAPPPSDDGSNGQPAKSDRDKRGRFVKGNPGGCGNPHARRMAALRASLREAVGEGGLSRLAEALLRRVEEAGDLDAARLLLDYTVGKPIDSPHPDSLDRDEYNRLNDSPRMDQIRGHLDRLPWDFALAAKRALQDRARFIGIRQHENIHPSTWEEVANDLGDEKLGQFVRMLIQEREEAFKAQMAKMKFEEQSPEQKQEKVETFLKIVNAIPDLGRVLTEEDLAKMEVEDLFRLGVRAGLVPSHGAPADPEEQEMQAGLEELRVQAPEAYAELMKKFGGCPPPPCDSLAS